MRPVIGINASLTAEESGNGAIVSVGAHYTDAIAMAGGVPLILPAVSDVESLRKQVKLCDGFVFVGGPDIDPARYGEKANAMVSALLPRREEYDFALVREVLAARKPFLGICLGCQEINVALGGTLIQDIASEVPAATAHRCVQASYCTMHDVKVEEDTILRRLLGVPSLAVNSSHHQAVKKPAGQLRISAYSEDGIIETLEMRDYPFGLAIQWHPELLTSEPLHLRLFEGLVEAAERGK